MRELHGVLVVDKPTLVTSAVAVARVRKALKPFGGKKAGHTGTLDPLATGVLPIVLGDATKLATYLLADDKAYEADALFGVETETLDADGAVTARAPERAAAVTAADLRAELARLVGAIEQVPPMYSAIKHLGRPLHELAREGAEVDRAPRAVVIHRLELLAWEPPRARLAIACSKGTYVRTLVADLGRALGCGAHLTALRRTRSGAFSLADAIEVDAVYADPAAAALRIIPPERALGLPSIAVPDADLRTVRDGAIPPAIVANLPTPLEKDGLVQLVTPAGDLLALVQAGRLVRVFTYGLTHDPRSRKVPATS